MRSMTAFVSVPLVIEGAHYVWEIRSLNTRFLEVSFRLPESFRHQEGIYRQSVKKILNRGKVDCTLRQDMSFIENKLLAVNEDMVKEVLALSERLSEHYQVANDMTTSYLLSFPGVMQSAQTSPTIDDQLVENGLMDALTLLTTIREKEGAAIKNEIVSRLHQLKALTIKHIKLTKLHLVSIVYRLTAL